MGADEAGAQSAAKAADVSGPVVSDHALIRWLERVHGVDIEGFRKALRAEIAHLSVADIGRYYCRRSDHTLVFEDGVLKTVLSPGMMYEHRRRTHDGRKRRKGMDRDQREYEREMMGR